SSQTRRHKTSLTSRHPLPASRHSRSSHSRTSASYRLPLVINSVARVAQPSSAVRFCHLSRVPHLRVFRRWVKLPRSGIALSRNTKLATRNRFHTRSIVTLFTTTSFFGLSCAPFGSSLIL